MSLDPERIPSANSPYVYAYIDGRPLIARGDRPQRLTGFNYIRNNDISGNWLILSVFDNEWPTVESMLVATTDKKLRFQYGYSNGVMSEEKEALINNYTKEFKTNGFEHQIEAVSMGASSEDREKSRVFPECADKDYMDIHEIVKFIADENGWECDYDETAKVENNDDLEKTEIRTARWPQLKKRDMQFIVEDLLPKARRKSDGNSDYKFWFEDGIPPKIHFHPPRFEQKAKDTYTFMFGDKLSEVVSWRPELTGTVNLRLGAGVAGCPYIDYQTGEFNDVIIHNNNTQEKTVLGGPLTLGSKVLSEEWYNFSELKPVRDASQAELAARHRYFMMYNSIQKSTITVVGDPQIKTHVVIRVNVVLPDGKLDYSSGLWYVLNAIDEIHNGVYTTKMELIRNGLQNMIGATGQEARGTINE